MPLKTYRQFLDEAKGTVHEFSSTHVLLPHDLAQSVIHWGLEEIPEEDLFKDPEDPSFGRGKEPHVTVLNGLLGTDGAKFAPFFAKKRSIPVKLGRLSAFTTSDQFDVLKIEVTSPGLRQLNSEMREAFPNHQPYPSYRPHVTVAYVKKGKAKRLEGNDFFLGQSFPVREITFSSREGKVSVFPLGNPKKGK